MQNESDMAETFERLLSSDYDLQIAISGHEALEKLDRTIDAVLFDPMIPGMSGGEILAEIRSQGINCCIAMTTVDPDFGIIEISFNEYIKKPADAEELRVTVERLINRSTLNDDLQEYYSLISKRPGWTSHSQASSQRLVTGGKRSITIRPDVLVPDEEGRPVLVGDAKWKVDEPGSRVPSNDDIYQLVAYQVAHDVPGVLLYPEQAGKIRSQYSVRRLKSLALIEISLSQDRSEFDLFKHTLVEEIDTQLVDVLN